MYQTCALWYSIYKQYFLIAICIVIWWITLLQWFLYWAVLPYRQPWRFQWTEPLVFSEHLPAPLDSYRTVHTCIAHSTPGCTSVAHGRYICHPPTQGKNSVLHSEWALRFVDFESVASTMPLTSSLERLKCETQKWIQSEYMLLSEEDTVHCLVQIEELNIKVI